VACGYDTAAVEALMSARWPGKSRELDLTGWVGGLQWARAVAVIAVVTTHAVAHPFPGAPGVTHLLGRFGVTLFFVISGLIMVLNTGPSIFDPVAFMRRRITRIVPLYTIATLLVAMIALFMPWAFKETVFDVRHTLLSLLFIPAYEPGGSGRIDPVLRLGWTLNFEMFFYFVFACLCGLSAVSRAVALTVIYGALITLGLTIEFDNAILAFHTRIDCLGFVAGVWLALYCVHRKTPVSRVTFNIFVVAAMVNLAVMAWFYGTIKFHPATQVWLVGICTAVAALFALRPAAFDNSRFSSLMMLIGDSSYSIYLFHMFAVGLATWLSTRLLPVAAFYLMMAVALLTGVAVGIVTHFIVERPLLRAFRPRKIFSAQ
jgi:exopolysaccharide production protein ExoZ